MDSLQGEGGSEESLKKEHPPKASFMSGRSRELHPGLSGDAKPELHFLAGLYTAIARTTGKTLLLFPKGLVQKYPFHSCIPGNLL